MALPLQAAVAVLMLLLCSGGRGGKAEAGIRGRGEEFGPEGEVGGNRLECHNSRDTVHVCTLFGASVLHTVEIESLPWVAVCQGVDTTTCWVNYSLLLLCCIKWELHWLHFVR